MLPPFQIANQSFRESLQTVRTGETRLGQVLPFPKGETITDMVANSSAKLVILGIQEDIGVQGNFGRPGANGNWIPFLQSFLNLQNRTEFDAESILILGHIDGSQWQEELEWERPAERFHKARKITEYQIDPLVRSIAATVFASGKKLLVIGGGHNNAYPLLSALYQSNNQPVNVLNFDAHTDLRALEGRHSGNGFRYAWQDGAINKYAVVGLQPAYTSQEIKAFMDSLPENFQAFIYDAAVKHPVETRQAVDFFFANNIDALEIDLDVVADFPSSALSPLGFTFPELYQWFDWTLSTLSSPQYVHLCEAAPSLVAGSEGKVGKALAALVYRFCA